MVLYAPEIGLCTAALCLAFVPKVHLISLICYTFCCYLIKVVRGKRNLHIDSGSVFVLFLFACFGFNAIKGGGENALFAFSAVAVYIMAANLLATEKLLKKCIQALCLGLGGVVAVYLFQLLVGAYNGVAVLDVLAGSCSVFENSGSLIIFCVTLLPFQFCKAGLSTPFSRPLCYILTAAIMCYSVYTGHVFYAVATAIAVTLFLSVNLRSVFIPLLLCVAVPLLTLYFSGISIDLGDMGIYNTVSGWVSAIKTSLQSPIFGLGMSAETLSVAAVADSHSMYFQTLVECGITGLVLLTLALVFSGQKLYTALPRVNKDGRRIAAAAGASSITAMLFGMGNNLWQESGVCVVLWLSLGMASAACHARLEEKREMDDELYGK